MNKNLTIASVLGALTVILGAFGAHALKEMVSETQLKSFETAVKYQFIHIIVIMLINMYTSFSTKTKNILTYVFLAGILFFSGSIYAITLGVSAKNIWFITPLGGLLFIAGWLKLAYTFYKNNNS